MSALTISKNVLWISDKAEKDLEYDDISDDDLDELIENAGPDDDQEEVKPPSKKHSYKVMALLIHERKVRPLVLVSGKNVYERDCSKMTRFTWRSRELRESWHVCYKGYSI